jgi:hypothetical protein
MAEKESQSLDVLGIKPVGEAIQAVGEKSLDGAGAFLGKICLPVAEEFGLFLKDRVHVWRSYNVIKALEKAENKYKEIHGKEKKEIHPRMLSSIIENVSWTDDEDIQELWGGLLASSCSENGKDDSNIIFISILSQLTSLQVKILNVSCLNAKKYLAPLGWIYSEGLNFTIEQVQQLFGENNLQRLDRELIHLRSLGLIQAVFDQSENNADLTPTPLAFHLFVRCQGSLEDPVKYFEKELETAS